MWSCAKLFLGALTAAIESKYHRDLFRIIYIYIYIFIYIFACQIKNNFSHLFYLSNSKLMNLGH